MSRAVISVENLGKEYFLGGRQVAGETFREMLVSAAAAPFRRLKRSGRVPDESIWALKDVNFEVGEGEVVGIIGRNGAGKSTLLKILSRITEPTTGRITIRGRVSSLLEVGTGFHPELTGRENVYLNGAILGMSRAEINAKFDEIVDFSGVEKFLDTPVKRYSSGMSVRLAFAVAAHLEPEILIVDEVLAVGDAEFQRKSLGKMHDVAASGRTVLFVSHNLPAVTSLCSRGLLLVAGEVWNDGSVPDAITSYLGSGTSATTLSGRRIDVSANVEHREFRGSTAFAVIFDVVLRGPLDVPHIGMGINDAQAARIASVFSETDRRLPSLAEGESLSLRMETEPLRFAPGTLLIKVALEDQGGYSEAYEDALQLVVPEYSPFQYSPHTRPRGVIWVRARVTHESAS